MLALRQKSRELKPSDRLLECSQCKAIRTGGKPCGHCGFMPRRAGAYLDVIDGDLAHIGQNRQQKAPIYTQQERREFQPCCCTSRSSVVTRRAGQLKFKEKFGQWPLDRNIAPMRPNAEVLAWDRHLRIRYAKSMEKNNRRVAYA